MRYFDIDPQDIDPETNRPYVGYSSPSLDTSFHDHEMDVDDEPSSYRTQYEQNRTWSVYEGSGFRKGGFRTEEEARAWADGYEEALR